MTAPAAPRVPTPGDLARRRPPAVPPAAQTQPTPPDSATSAAPRPGPSLQKLPTAADFIAPGILRPNEHMRAMYQQAMRGSRMRPEARLVGLTLLGYANYKTGLLTKYQPTTAQLSYATGLAEGQVLVQIEVLTQRGWLEQRRLTQGPRTGQLVFHLRIPNGVLQQLRSRPSGATT